MDQCILQHCDVRCPGGLAEEAVHVLCQGPRCAGFLRPPGRFQQRRAVVVHQWCHLDLAERILLGRDCGEVEHAQGVVGESGAGVLNGHIQESGSVGR